MTPRPLSMALALGTAALLGCKADAPPKPESEPTTTAPSPKDAPPAVSEPTAPNTDAPKPPSGNREKTAALLAEGKIIAIRLLSPRSYSLKIRLEGGAHAVFKPLRKEDRRAPYEIAASRIAALLDIPNVPVSVRRRIPANLITARLEKDDPALPEAFREAVIIDDRGWTEGAVIEWMENIDPDGLKAAGGVPALNRMLRPARAANGDESLACAASNMVVFDHLIGNWDRFSGGNFFVTTAGTGLVLIDHNGSFIPWPEKRQERMEKRLAMTERYSQSLLDRLRTLDRKSVAEAVAEVDGGALLSKEEIDLLLSRRDEVVRRVDALIAQYGVEKTVVFP